MLPTKHSAYQLIKPIKHQSKAKISRFQQGHMANLDTTHQKVGRAGSDSYMRRREKLLQKEDLKKGDKL